MSSQEYAMARALRAVLAMTDLEREAIAQFLMAHAAMEAEKPFHKMAAWPVNMRAVANLLRSMGDA